MNVLEFVFGFHFEKVLNDGRIELLRVQIEMYDDREAVE